MFIYSVITQKKVFQSFLSQLSFVNANSAALMFLAYIYFEKILFDATDTQSITSTSSNAR